MVSENSSAKFFFEDDQNKKFTLEKITLCFFFFKLIMH